MSKVQSSAQTYILAARLREEVVGAGGVARLPALVSAWTRIGES